MRLRTARGYSRGIVGLLVLVTLWGSYALRLWDVAEPSIWHDEGWSIRAIRDPIGTPDDNTPPVYYMVMHVFWRGAGESPLALRYGSVLVGLVTVALALRLAGRWGGRLAGLAAGIFVGLSPLMWAYAREIRAYVVVPLFALLLLALVERLLASRNRVRWRVFGALLITELVLLYTHNLSVPVVAWLNLVVGGVWVWDRRWRWLGWWVLGQGILLLAYLPWLFGQSPSGTPINSPPRWRPALAWDIWRAAFEPLPTMIGAETTLERGMAVLGVCLVGSICMILLRIRRRPELLVVSQAVLLPILATVELQAANIDFHPRYYVAGVPAALIVLAMGLARFPIGERWRMVAGGIVALLMISVSGGSLSELFNAPEYQHDDFRAIAAHYAALPDDALIVIPYGWEPSLDVYYGDRMDIRAEVVGIDLHSDVEQAIDAINGALATRSFPVRVELLTWFQLPADLRGMYGCLLEAAGRPVETLTVQGVSTTGYEVERLLARGELDWPPASYGVIDLKGGTAAGRDTLCVESRWQLARNTGEDLRVSARLVTTQPPGWIIARSDTDIRTREQVPTSAWQAGDEGAAFSLLRVPAGAPPIAYSLQLIVFSHERPNGLNRLVNGVPAGVTFVPGTLTPKGATDHAPSEAIPVPLEWPAAEDIDLLGHDAQGGMLTAGQELRITLHWQASPSCCHDVPWTNGVVVLQGEGWHVEQPVTVYPEYSLDWIALMVPAEASGSAELFLEIDSGETLLLASYTVEATERLFAPPPIQWPVGAEFIDLAVLEGVNVAQTTIQSGEALALDLVWRVETTPARSWWVFTHLLNDEGRVVAQHDSVPVSGNRPTTSWVAGEYIVDPYQLTFNDEGRDYRGLAHLEVGFYDPDTGQRVHTAGGSDHIILPIEITIE